MKIRNVAWTIAFAVTSAAAQAGGPSDPQIAAIVVTANQVDVDAGRLAQKKSKTQDVAAFAERMVVDHEGVNKSATELVTRLHVTPESNPTSESLQQGGAANLAKLQALSGSDFDRAYVAHEVDYHVAVLEALDKTLIPNAKNAELEALLVKVRPAFVAHLEHARHLQATLNQASAAPHDE